MIFSVASAPLRLCLLGAALLTLLPSSLLRATSAGREDPWATTSRSLFKEAHAGFVSQQGREARFGEAVTLLSLQPKTNANLDRAAALLEEISLATPLDDLAISARYYLARIDQIHRTPAAPEAARRRYEELAALGSEHPLAQRAVVQLALIDLFAPGLAEQEAKARFARNELRGEGLTEASAKRDFHLVVGEAAQRLGLGDEPALRHLLAADRAGLARAITRRDVWIRIAELAHRTGDEEVAIEYYRRFLDTFQRDSRRFMIEQRLGAFASPPEGTK